MFISSGDRYASNEEKRTICEYVVVYRKSIVEKEHINKKQKKNAKKKKSELLHYDSRPVRALHFTHHNYSVD